MKRSFKLILWGLLFLSLDFRIFNINIFQDFIGYIIIACGIKGMSKDDESLFKIYEISMLLGIISMFVTVKNIIHPFDNNSLTIESFIALFVSILITIGKLYVIYNIIEKIYKLSIEQNLTSISDACKWRWNFLVGTTFLNYLLLPVVYNISYGWLTTLLGILNILQGIASIFILFLVNNARKKLEFDFIAVTN